MRVFWVLRMYGFVGRHRRFGDISCISLQDDRISCEERENQQDATIRFLLSTSVSTCFGQHYAHLQEKKDRVLLHIVYCAGSAGCGTPQPITPYAVSHGLYSHEDGHNDARSMLRQKLITNTWLLHLVGFLPLHRKLETKRNGALCWSLQQSWCILHHIS